MATTAERQKILDMINNGQITADQGAELLAALNNADQNAEPQAEPKIIEPAAPPEPLPNFSNLWLIPLGIGTFILIIGGFMLSAAYQAGGWFMFVCGWPTFMLGLLVIVAAWFAQRGPWVHIRITNQRRDRRNFKLSVPLNPAVFILKIVRPFIPKLKETGVDEVLLSLQGNVNRNQPLVIDVNESDDGERVQVVIG